MKLDIREVLDLEGERKDFAGKLDLSWVKRLGESLFPESLAVGGRVENRAGVVSLRYQIDGVMPFVCDRCLMQTKRPISEEFSHTVVRSLEDDALDDIFIVAPDSQINIAEIAATDLQLMLPQVFLCKDDCKGLCPRCGADLNQTTCGCREDNIDPRLEILRKLLNNDDE
ncbi:MAG: DUF177 domain-containing protein [Oscillospiraceae bacterium]|nr:DUF177 domain-containing protein [Oscillospiraceae bacterium]